MTSEQAITAIKARIKGEFDNPELLKLGMLSPNPLSDIKVIASMVNDPEPIEYGDWSVKPFRSITGLKYSIVSNYEVIAKCDNESHAEILAASPELYKALNKLTDMLLHTDHAFSAEFVLARMLLRKLNYKHKP